MRIRPTNFTSLSCFLIRNRARSGRVSIIALAWLFLQTVPVHATVNVVSYWRLGESDPTAAPGATATNTIDSAGYTTLQFRGNARYASDVAATAASHAGSSVSINFTNGAYATNRIVSTATDNFGIECWVKPTTSGVGEVIAYNGSTGGLPSGGWGLIIASDGTYQALYGGVTLFGTNTATPGVWTHLALVRASGTATLYVNGVPTVTAPDLPLPAPGNFGLAAPPQSPTGQYFTGLIDEVRVFTFAPGQFSTNDLLIYQIPSVTLSPANLVEGPSSGSDSVGVSVVPLGTSWSASANASWLHVAQGSRVGGESASFTFDANVGPTRTGTLTIGGQTLTVTQAGTNYVPATVFTLAHAGLNQPYGVSVDSVGSNVYISSYSDLKVWKSASNAVYELAQIPEGIADQGIDNAGNVYFTFFNEPFLGEWVADTGTVTNVANFPALINPAAIAVDGAGNVYMTDEGTNGSSNATTVKEYNAAVGSVSTLVSGVNDDLNGIARDRTGNIYFAGGNTIMREWIAASNTVINLATTPPGLRPVGLVADSGGNVFFCGYAGNSIFEVRAIDNAVVTTVSGQGLNTPVALALDDARNLYIADVNATAIKELPHAFVDTTPRVEPFPSGTDSLPPVLPATANLTGPFQPTSDQPWLTITGVSNGVVSYAYVISPTSTNRTAHISLLGQQISITRPLTFVLGTSNLVESSSSGADSVVVAIPSSTNSWTALANTNWLHVTTGTGFGNVIFTFDDNPGVTRVGTLSIGGQTVTITQAGSTFVSAGLVTLVSSGLYFPAGLAIDSAGDVYIADSDNKAVREWNVTNQTVTTLVSSGLGFPYDVAVDAAGNVYIADSDTNVIKEWIASSQTVTNLFPMGNPLAVALDIAGNVYTGDRTDNRVQEWLASSHTLTNLFFASLEGVAVDVAGNVYFNDGYAGGIHEWFAASQTTTALASGTNNPGVAVDGSGNVYFVDSDNGLVIKWTAAIGSANNLVGGLSFPEGVAVDNAENVYMSDSGFGFIRELPRAFVDATPRNEPATAGHNQLPLVVPATANLTGVFYPTSDQPWLTINSATGGMVDIGFTATTTNRTGHVTVLGVPITVTQNVSVTPPILTGITLLSNGQLQFGFTNNPNASFTVLASTNLALPLTNWSVVGTPSDLGGGNWSFTAPPLTNSTHMFYRVRSP